MRSLVEMVLSGRENAKDAKKKLVQYKAKIVQEVNEESKELMRVALEEVWRCQYTVCCNDVSSHDEQPFTLTLMADKNVVGILNS